MVLLGPEFSLVEMVGRIRGLDPLPPGALLFSLLGGLPSGPPDDLP